jgi:predicted DNA-binding helix-hairpin-helix protein
MWCDHLYAVGSNQEPIPVRVSDSHDVLKSSSSDQRDVNPTDVGQRIDGVPGLGQHSGVLRVVLERRESAVEVECHQNLGVNRKISQSLVKWVVALEVSH